MCPSPVIGRGVLLTYVNVPSPDCHFSSAGPDQGTAVKPNRPGFFPPAQWLAEYRACWLRLDIIAGVTLAAYAIPVSLAYATLAGLPPQIGVYGYMLGGIGYALLGSSRQLAVGPTSAI